MGDYVVNKDGALVDVEDGTVVSEAVFDYGPEWRAFTPAEKMAKSRAQVLSLMRHDTGASTFVAGRLGSVHSSVVKSTGDKKLYSILEELRVLCRMHATLPRHICSDAAHAARMLARDKTRTSNRLLALAALYHAAARNGISAARLGISTSQLSDIYHVLAASSLRHARNVKTTIMNEISRIASQAKLPPPVQLLAGRIYAYFKHKLQGSNPRSVAAALLYIAAKLSDVHVTQKELADKVGVTDATIRNHVKRLGITIVYSIVLADGTRLEYGWYPGIDSYGLRMPGEIAMIHGINNYTTKITLGSPITVEIREVRK